MDSPDLRQETPGTLRLESDVNDPLNWPIWYKAINFALVCFYVLMVFVNLDIGPVIWNELYTDLHISFQTSQISFGLNTTGLAVGCCFFIPLAQIYGRRVIYLASIVVAMASSIWQARMMTAGDLLGANMISGLGGAVSEVICQMTIADMFFVQQRGAANAIFMFMTAAGAFLGPVAAGYCAASQGWRWIWWWATILLGACCVLFFFFFYEDTKYTAVTHEFQLQEQVEHTRGKSSKDGNPSETNPLQNTMSLPSATPTGQRRKSYSQRLRLITLPIEGTRSLARLFYEPFVILFTFPAITYTAITYGSLLAWFSVLVNIYSTWFTLPPYNFSPSAIGLLNLPPFVGTLLDSIFAGTAMDKIIVRLARRNNGMFEPEMRLWVAIPAIVIMPLSIAVFGVTTAWGAHWIVPSIALGLFGFAFTLLGDVALTYAMDCYTTVVGDAFTAVVFVRNACATIIATTLTDWINGVGLINTIVMSTVLSFVLSVAVIPMIVYGKRLRAWTEQRYKAMLERRGARR